MNVRAKFGESRAIEFSDKNKLIFVLTVPWVSKFSAKAGKTDVGNIKIYLMHAKC